MKTDYLELIKQIDIYTKENVKQKRYEHSVRVAQMCARLCRQFGIDENLGYLEGISHDMCKDMSDEELIEISKRNKTPIIQYELEHPKILHGRAASVLLKEKFGINNQDILQAVEVHTSGKIGMCDLAKILFIADKIEPGRPQSTEEYRHNLLEMNLEKMFYTVLYESYEFINKKVQNGGYDIYPGTKEVLEYYKGKIDEKNS